NNIMPSKAAAFLLLLSLAMTIFVRGQVHSFDIGLRFQKSVGLYNENGIVVQFNQTQHWVFSATYVSSRFGTAWGTNAIKQDNLFASAAYKIRPTHRLQPFLRANLGYFNADYGPEIFKSLTHSSVIAAFDLGLSYAFKFPIKIIPSFGYNTITGDGKSGAGTLYPVFYQLSVTYNLSKLFAR
ncbi:MAG: hypothetical protein ABI151_00190, partial [Chitinophagaceae bacterium]